MPPSRDSRDARARALGYRSWYDYRLHDYGRIPPSQPPLQGEEAQQARGHRGPANLDEFIASGRIELISAFPVGERDPKTGQWQQFDLVTVDSQGRQRSYRLRGQQVETEYLRGLKGSIDAAGIGYVASPSLDVFDLGAPDVDEVLDWLDYEEDAG